MGNYCDRGWSHYNLIIVDDFYHIFYIKNTGDIFTFHVKLY